MRFLHIGVSNTWRRCKSSTILNEERRGWSYQRPVIDAALRARGGSPATHLRLRETRLATGTAVRPSKDGLGTSVVRESAVRTRTLCRRKESGTYSKGEGGNILAIGSRPKALDAHARRNTRMSNWENVSQRKKTGGEQKDSPWLTCSRHATREVMSAVV